MTVAEPNQPAISYLEAVLGLSFDGPRRARLLASVHAQRVAAGLSPEAYCSAISEEGPLFDRLVAEVTVGETSFFRDRAQCDLLRTVVLPELGERTAADQSIAMWSAGCASGEEAFTLAALADEAGVGPRCTVVGTDVSSASLAKARRSEYGAWSMRSTTPQEQHAYFQERDGRFEVAGQLRRATVFVQRNLFDGPPPPGLFDVVLCRNLLIYLNREAVLRAAAVLHGALAANGWLVTAAGDPPLDAPGLEPVRTRFGLAYRRAPVEAPAPPSVRLDVPARGRPAASGARGSRPAPRSHRPKAPAVASAVPPAPATGTPAGGRMPAELAEQVRALGNAGRLPEACEAAAAAVQAHPLDVNLRYLSAVVLLEAGRLDEAGDSAAAAVYLGPQLPAAHLLLGQVEHARGNTLAARRSFRNGSRLLRVGPDDARVELVGDVPPRHLAAIAARYLAVSGHPG